MRLSTVLILVGCVLLVIGLALRFAPGIVSWFGRLPGDLRVERDGVRVFVPLTSMLLLSVLLTLLLNLFGRLR